MSYIFCSKLTFIVSIFLACRINNVHLFDNDGTLANECFVALDSDIDVKDALKKSGSYLDKKSVEGTLDVPFPCDRPIDSISIVLSFFGH